MCGREDALGTEHMIRAICEPEARSNLE
jgi:hypothetical protein